MENGETLEVAQPDEFAGWLTTNGPQEREIWVVIYKKASGKQTATYQELVDIAIASLRADPAESLPPIETLAPPVESRP